MFNSTEIHFLSSTFKFLILESLQDFNINFSCPKFDSKSKTLKIYFNRKVLLDNDLDLMNLLRIFNTKEKGFIMFQNIKSSSRVIRPRFAGKCDRQSSDLIQFTSDYNFAVKPATNHPRSSCSNSHLR